MSKQSKYTDKIDSLVKSFLPKTSPVPTVDRFSESWEPNPGWVTEICMKGNIAPVNTTLVPGVKWQHPEVVEDLVVTNHYHHFACIHCKRVWKLSGEYMDSIPKEAREQGLLNLLR